MATKITSIDQLKKEAVYNEDENFAEFFMLLGNGLLRSSKAIAYHPDTNTFDVNNEIDDTYQDDLTEEQLRTETLIVEAIEKGAFYKY